MMNEQFDEILAQCLDDIESGKRSVAACIAAHPEVGDELEQMLQTSQILRDVGLNSAESIKPSPTYKAQARQRLLDEIRPKQAVEPARQQRVVPQPTFAERVQSWLFGGRPAIGFALAGVVVLLLLSGGAIFASNNAIPGETLYSMKTGVEDVRLNLAEEEDTDYIDLQLSFADRRLSELEELVAEKRTQYITSTSDAYAEHVDSGILRIDSAKGRAAKPIEAIEASFGDALSKHELRLESLAQRVADLPADSEGSGTPSLRSATQALVKGKSYIQTGDLLTEPVSLYNFVVADERFSQFQLMVNERSLNSLLHINGPFTLFLPSDVAIETISAEWNALGQDNSIRERHAVLYHMLQGEYDLEALKAMDSVVTAFGPSMALSVSDGKLMLDGVSYVVSGNIEVENGIIHFIDRPLFPPLPE